MEPRVFPDRGGTGPVSQSQINEPSQVRAIEESRTGSPAAAQTPTPALLDSWFAKETTETNATPNKATEATSTADDNKDPATRTNYQGSSVSHLADAASAAPRTPANKSEPTSKLLSSGRPDSLQNQPSASPPVHDAGTEQAHKATASVRRPSLAVNPATNHAAIDPLSQHIFMRTNTERNLTSKLRNPTSKSDASAALDGQRLAGDATDTPDKKRPRSSFLSRLGMRANRLRNDDDDSGSDVGSQRPDGNNARVFASPVGAQGYIPHHKEPPRYIRTKVYNKKEREFNRMFLAQELVGTRPLAQAKTDEKVPVVTVSSADGTSRRAERTGGAVWATEFSRDGRYLAAAGKDQVVRVWAVISTIEERRTREDEEEALHQQSSPISSGGGGGRERLQAPVFREQPLREFQGHTGEILDLSWSKNNFLLSTSMDRTVRLWHVSRKECLCAFRHGEFVSKVAFHPQDDRFFLAGCLDSRLRLWSIPDRSVAFEAQTNDMITAVAFTPDGKTAIAGMLNGVCNFYETEGLKFQSLLHVRSSRGKNAKGSKITGIRTAEVPAGSGSSEKRVKVLVTSTDARVRVYNLGDKALDAKFKGHEHAAAQLSASFSHGANYVICPSEHRKVFIWSLGSPNQRALNISNSGGIGTDTLKGDKGPCESFVAHGSGVTTAIFAPAETRQLLGASGDPIYDLCNPPPVTLVSREEEAAAAAATSSSRDPSPTSPARTAHNMSQTALSEAPSVARSRRVDESPAYLARSTHQQGNIIVTTDDTGIIKVFRQDCAYRRREGPDTASLLSRKRDSIVGRSASILTRTSASSAAHSRKGSLSRSIQGIMTGEGMPQSGGAMSEQILDWRRDVEANGRSGSINSAGGTPIRVERSVSPTKSPLTARTLASERRREQYAHSGSPLVPRGDRGHFSPTSSTFSNPPRIRSDAAVAAGTVANASSEDPTEDGVAKKPLDQPTCSSKQGETTADAQKKSTAEDETLNGGEGATPAPSSPSGEGGANNGGLWGFRWPKMPTLRMSIGGIGMGSGTASPGKDGVGPGASDGQSPVPGGYPSLRASSELSIKDKIKEASKMSKDKGKEKEKERKARTPPLQIPSFSDKSIRRQSQAGDGLLATKDERSSEAAVGSEEEMACPKCGAREFKAKKLNAGQQQQRQRLVCATCATPAAEQES
ncbi:uncharacterized protein PpBr36_10867 [Pyricularia pennisetigena]|uniref:uncharacterized protein n=1 Tax=Pyricularia pennisetigena TaxID=1578925 RepID=UPI00114F76F4|nr:uncharacterized protein PpBr36_10867 [Pyricularia pennisetigena]TLS20982.1 hypothetical protein PpBr36_10867 [Pyricularia pennisetigena]